jgi:hypothetical protein
MHHQVTRTTDRVRAVASFVHADAARITERTKELEREWDTEFVLEINTSALAFSGLLLGLTTGNKKWVLMLRGNFRNHNGG